VGLVEVSSFRHLVSIVYNLTWLTAGSVKVEVVMCCENDNYIAVSME